MEATSRTKWVVTIIIAGILLGLAMVGGKWGISYAADDNPVPYVDEVKPFGVRVGSTNEIVIISGGNFDVSRQPRVTLQYPNQSWVTLAAPLQVLPNGISQVIPASYLTQPMIYNLGVYHYGDRPNTVPSNGVPFYVYEPQYSFLTLVKK